MLIETLQPLGLGVSLRLMDAPALGAALRAAMPGWPLSRWPARAALSRQLCAWHEREAYYMPVPNRPRPVRLTGVAAAACGVIADLIPLVLDHWPEAIGLHCAAVEVEGRLLVFPATHRAGKSVLATAFAAAGYRVFADDVLVLTPDGQGMALGISPRIRRPLPALDPRLARFIADHEAVSDHRYRYVDPGPARLAAHGERRPLGAIVLLERLPGAEPTLMPLPPGEGLLRLLSQSLADRRQPDVLLKRLLPMMHALPCRLLRYDEPMAAVERIAAVGRDGGIAPAVETAGSEEAERSVPSDLTWRRRAVEAEYPLHDELFLIDDRGRVHRLSAVAAGIWRLLGTEPLSRAEVVTLLAARFPGTERSRLAADVAAFLDEASRLALIAPAES
ncbi:PqqD family protein [Halomonas organivorans]